MISPSTWSRSMACRLPLQATMYGLRRPAQFVVTALFLTSEVSRPTETGRTRFLNPFDNHKSQERRRVGKHQGWQRGTQSWRQLSRR